MKNVSFNKKLKIDPKRCFTIVKQKEVLSIDQVEKLVNNAKSYQYQLMILIMVQTGMRVGELVNFKINWINEPNNSIRIQANKKPIEWSPKRKSARAIPITDNLLRNLKKHIGKRTNGYLLQSPKTKTTVTRNGVKITKKTYRRYSYRSIIKIMNALFIETLGYKPQDESTHLFRHTYASRLLKDKIDVASIKKLLGHKDIKTTWLYIQSLPDFNAWDEVRKVDVMNLNVILKK